MEIYLKTRYTSYILSIYHIPKIRNYYLYTELEEVQASDKKQKQYRDLNLFIQEIIINYSNYRFIKLSLKNNLNFEEVEQAQLDELKLKINNDFNSYKNFYDDIIEEAISVIFIKAGIQIYSYTIEKYTLTDDFVSNIIVDCISKSNIKEIDNYCFLFKNFELHLQYLKNLIKNIREFKYPHDLKEYTFLFNSMIFSCDEKCYLFRKNLLNLKNDEYEFFCSPMLIPEEEGNEKLYKPLENHGFLKADNKIKILQIIFTKLTK